MKMNQVAKGLLGIALGLVSFAVAAEEDRIMCPDVAVINQSSGKLNTVSELKAGKFAIGGLTPLYDAHRPWFILTFANAIDFNSAFKAGQANITGINERMEKYPSLARGVYVCSYLSMGNGLALSAAISFKDSQDKKQVFSLDPARYNLNPL